MNRYLLLIIFLLLLNGFFAGMEAAFLSLDLFFIEIKRRKKHKFSLLYHVLKKPEIVITTILVGTNITIISATQLLSSLLNLNLIINKIFLFFIFPLIVLIVSEMYPKILFSKYSYSISKIAVFLFFIFQLIFSPIVLIFNIISKFIELLFIKDKKYIEYNKNEEIKNILAASLKKKLSKNEIFIEDAIKFDEISLYDIQKPLFSLPTLNFDENNEIDLYELYENNKKNYVVFDSKNNFLGIINNDSIYDSGNIKRIYNIDEVPIIKNIPIVYEGKNILSAIELMNKNKSSFVLTINEFGQTSGLVTKEDIFSFISKRIVSKEDLYKYNIKKIGDNTYVIGGFAELTDVSRTLNIELKDDYYHTFNGYLIHHFGRIPKEGESILIDNKLEIKIVSSNKKFIEKAIVKYIVNK